jgi:hypothetical protein
MLVAMGVVTSSGALYSGYNVDSVTWNAGSQMWEIQLTGIDYYFSSYVTVVSAFSNEYAAQNSIGGKLQIRIYNSAGNLVKDGFSFVVFKAH